MEMVKKIIPYVVIAIIFAIGGYFIGQGNVKNQEGAVLKAQTMKLSSNQGAGEPENLFRVISRDGKLVCQETTSAGWVDTEWGYCMAKRNIPGDMQPGVTYAGYTTLNDCIAKGLKEWYVDVGGMGYCYVIANRLNSTTPMTTNQVYCTGFDRFGAPTPTGCTQKTDKDTSTTANLKK